MFYRFLIIHLIVSQTIIIATADVGEAGGRWEGGLSGSRDLLTLGAGGF